MKANCWYGKQDVRVETVPEPTILNKRDVISRSPPQRSAGPIFICTMG